MEEVRLLLRLQRDERTHAASSPRGQRARGQRNEQQDRGHGSEGRRIGGLDLVEQATENAREPERNKPACADTGKRQSDPLPHDQADDAGAP